MRRQIKIDENLRVNVEARGGVCRIGFEDDDGDEANIYLDRDDLERVLAAIEEIKPHLS